jgi:hypothetical protein
MYGLINRSIKELVLRHHGEGMWTRIAQRAGCGDTEFLGMESYPDELTYDLVGAASAELNVEPAALLEAFGRHWVLHSAPASYGDLMALTGSSVEEFLGNLDMLHDRVANILPALRPPEFRSAVQPDGSILLTYITHRPGLAPIVVGMVNGLGERFGRSLRIEHVERREDTGTHDLFRIV